MKKKKHVVILYRVVQHWRAPFFELLNKDENLDVSVWHGPDFSNSKLISTAKTFKFNKRKLFSLKIKLKTNNGKAFMPFSPFLFFSLIFKNPDVVITEGASNLLNSIQGFIYAKLFRKKFLWWSLGKIKNRSHGKVRSAFDNFIKYIERKSDAIISYSSRGKEYFLSTGVNEENIFVAVNVVDTEKIIKNLNKENYKSPFDFTVLFVGALTKEKNIDTLIKSFDKLKDYGKSIGLLIVGDGDYRVSLEKLVEKLELENVIFLGKRIEDNHLFFNAANLFVLPGLGGLAISEAMCYKLPVLCSIGDGCEVDLVTTKNGIIEEDMTKDNLAKHILWFYKNPSIVKEMSNQSYKIIESKFNTSNYVNKIKDAINS